MRDYIRHSAKFPVLVKLANDSPEQIEHTHNISASGLMLKLSRAVPEDALVEVTITSLTPPFNAPARVVWCRAATKGFDVGLRFVNADDFFAVRMVEQVYQIEEYKKHVLAREGRELSLEDAAQEWIDRYAARFPK